MIKKLTFSDHKRIARILRTHKYLLSRWQCEILNATRCDSRLHRNVDKLDRIFSIISSELERLYYRDTSPEERGFPDDLIHYGEDDLLVPKSLQHSAFSLTGSPE